MCVELVRALYDKQQTLPVDSNFYKQSLKEILNDGVSSQIYYFLKKQGKLEQTPLFFQERIKEKYNEALFQNLFIKNQAFHILKEFENEEIATIPLKGTFFAERYFGHIGARATSDIDLLIALPDVVKAVEKVKALGFTMEDFNPGHFHRSFSKTLPQSQVPLTVELHWDILKEDTANFNIADFWNHSLPYKGFSHVRELSDYHTFYMICLHGWRHNMDSMKYYIDILQLIDRLKKEIDFKRLLSDSVAYKTSKRMIRTLSIVYTRFPHLEQINSLPFKKLKVIECEKEENSLKKYLNFIDYQFLSYDSFAHRIKEVIDFIFPSKKLRKAEIGNLVLSKSTFLQYVQIYKKRISSLIKGILYRMH